MLKRLSGSHAMALVAVLTAFFRVVDVSTKALADRLQKYRESRWAGLSVLDAWRVSARPAIAGGVDAVTNVAAVSTDMLPLYIDERMIRLAERDMRLSGETCEKFVLPQRMGKVFQIDRFPRMNNPTAQLTEGVPPDAVALTATGVSATVEQWGIVGMVTDVAENVIRHSLLDKLIDRTERAIMETREREIATVLLAGTNVFFAASAADRAALDGTKKISTTDIVKMTTLLRDNGAGDFGGGMFIGYLPPQLEGDIMGDTTFANAASYSQVVRLNKAEIGLYGGVRWVRANFLPKYLGVAAPGTQSASVSGYGNETGAGGGIASAKIVVIARDVQSGYERKISQAKTVAAGKDTADVTTPTSTNYVYDIYQSNTAGAAYKRVFNGVAANTVKTLTATTYTNGTTMTPTSAPADLKEVFLAFVFGKEGYGDVELSGMSQRSYVTSPDASFSNPLAQARKVGTKYMAKPLILDNNYFARYEANSNHSINLPA